MTTITTNWTPEGAFRTAARRMKKRGVTDNAIVNTLLTLSAPDLQSKAKGNLGGAIKRCLKHGIGPNAIHLAMVNVAMALGKTLTETVVLDSVPAPAPKKKARRERTPEQIKADKERMAYVRSCRKTVQKARPSDYPSTEGIVVEEVPAETGSVKTPLTFDSFKELDAFLQTLS